MLNEKTVTNPLLDRLNQGDQGALQELFQEHYSMVCRTIHRLIPEQATVEDLAQEVFMRLWQKREQIHITSSPAAYLHRMAINEGLGYLRSRKFFTEEITPNHEGSTFSGGEEYVIQGELTQDIQQAIAVLPPKCRTVFTLSRFEELSYQEIADQLGISIKTVENQMGKALKIMRHELRNYLHTWFLLGLLFLL